jgi:hypothetical protein
MWRHVASPIRRRFDPVSIGFWLGGLALGIGGCILGACMNYRNPVAVTMSVLWWSIYLGCFGASIGALIGMWRDRTPASPTPEADGTGKLPSEVDDSSRLACSKGTRIGVTVAPDGLTLP